MPPPGDMFACSRRAPCSSWACKERGVSGLTIRSSRARFAASALAGYDLTIANAAQRPGLAQALGLSPDSMAEAKIQHYVPKFLLRNFGTGKKDQVWVYDKQCGRSFQTNAKNVASENRFYDFVIDGETYSLEDSLSKIESRTKPVISKILGSDSISVLDLEERNILSWFLAIQFIRTRSFREQWAELPRILRRKLESLGEEVAPGSQAAALMEEPSENQVKIDTARMILAAPETYGPHFFNKVWFLAKTTPSHPFILGDNPVSLQNHVEMEPYGNIGLAVRGIQIYLPLSTTRALAMWCPTIAAEFSEAAENIRSLPSSVLAAALKDPDGILAIERALNSGSTLDYKPTHVMNLNSLQVSRSERYLFSCGNDFSLADRMISDHPIFRSGQRIVSA